MARYIDITGDLPDSVRHWYIAGPDRGLVLGAYQEIRRAASEHTDRVERLDGTDVTADTVIELLRGAGSIEGEKPTLILLDNAEHVDLTSLSDLTTREYPSWLIAVGGHERPTSKDERLRYFYGRQAARMVSCTSPNEARTLVWVQKRLGCTADTARALSERAGRDTEWLAQEMHKLSPLGYRESLEPGHVPLITSPGASGDFIKSLLVGNKGTALACIPSPDLSPSILRQLETLVVKGALVYEAQKNVGWSTRILLDRTGLSQSELAMLRQHVNVFGRIPTERRLRALARVSTRVLRGERTAWQTLVALW